MKLLIVVNDFGFFLSHRLPIAKAARADGYEVHVAAGGDTSTASAYAETFTFHPLHIDRNALGLGQNFRLLGQLVALMRRVRPDILHLVTMKALVLGGLAARLTRVPAVVAAFSGLGYLFLAEGRKAQIRRQFLALTFRLVLTHPRLMAIFQNSTDRDVICSNTGLSHAKTALIRGSGVDLAAFPAHPLPDGIPIVMMAARFLKDKGVYEFLQASEILRADKVNARFVLVGNPDPGNPVSISLDEIASANRAGIVEVWDYSEDMARTLQQATICVLPSYREGLPKVLTEAAAVARPVVTTDVPGCRDAIDPGKSGLLIPVKDTRALADAIQHLLSDRDEMTRMGQAGRLLAEQTFDVQCVAAQHLRLYASLGTGWH